MDWLKGWARLLIRALSSLHRLAGYWERDFRMVEKPPEPVKPRGLYFDPSTATTIFIHILTALGFDRDLQDAIPMLADDPVSLVLPNLQPPSAS